MLSLGALCDRIEWKDKHRNPARRQLIADYAQEVYERIWTKRQFAWRRTRGSFQTKADYSTGTAAVTGAGVSRTVTITGGTLTQDMVFDMLEITPSAGGSAKRDYQVLSISGSGPWTVVLDDPYEDSTETVATYRIRRKWFRLPSNFESWETGKTTGGPRMLYYTDRAAFEAAYANPSDSGTAFQFIPAGVTTRALFSTGTLTLTRGSGTATLAGGTPVDARDLGRRLRPRGYPWEFKVTAVSGADYTIDPVWPDTTVSGVEFEIDPAGETLVQLQPHEDGATSALFWYFIKPPALINDYMVPIIPKEFHWVWVAGVEEEMGIEAPGKFEYGMAQLIAADGPLAKNLVAQHGSYNVGERLPSALPGNYPYSNPLTEG